MNANLPAQMRAVTLAEHHQELDEAIRGLTVTQRPVPTPGRGQVLVKIEAAPCNPSDLIFLQGRHDQQRTLPAVPGREGAGTVVASGGGWFAGWLKGRRVACAVRGDRDGTWAEYFLADAADCIPLKRKLTLRQGASLIINPLTAMGLLATARADGHRGAIHTAAASQLGRMLLPLAAEADFPLICVVRRTEQVELLKAAGAAHVLNSSDDDFPHRLHSACREHGVTAAFDAVGGAMTGMLLAAMPARSCVYLYGSLAGEPCRDIGSMDLIYHGKKVAGFYLADWLGRRGLLRNLAASNRAQQMLIDGRIETKVQRRMTLDEVVDGLRQYVNRMTDGKTL
ncbi:MAG: zinc-binding dehydrogenase, partial [Planctomycetes bacterium]|nr:zinc-binding dehydrogenase [Planctomycetota bacterium]